MRNYEKNDLNDLLEILKAQLEEYNRALFISTTVNERASIMGKIAEKKIKIKKIEKELSACQKNVQEVQWDKLTKIKEKMETDISTSIQRAYDNKERQFIDSGYLPLNECQIDKKVLQSWILKISSAKSTDTKGKLFEELVEFLFRSCPELFEIEYKRKRTRTNEIDRVIATKPGSFFVEWGTFILVECKNTARKSGSRVIASMENVLRLSRSSAAIIFSCAGFSKDALIAIREIFLRDEDIIIPISGEDIQAIADGENFVRILWDKYKWIRFG